MSTVDEVLLGSTDTSDEFLRMLLSSIALTTTHVNEINTNTGTSTNSNSVSDVKASSSTNTIEESCNYYKRNNSEIRNVTIVNKASSLIQKIANYCKTEHSIQLPDNYSDPLFYEKIVEIVEVLVEKADDNLRKIRKDELDRDNQGSDRKISELVTQSLLNDHERLIQSHIVHLEKPQLKFHQDIDNSRNNPFKPKLLKKYHFIQPFKLVELAVENSEDDVECPSTYYAHPYEAELLGLEYPPSQLTDMSKAAMPTTTSLEQTLELIFDENDFVEMLQDLASEKEIAVALKQHNLRSFQGFTCLMQVCF